MKQQSIRIKIKIMQAFLTSKSQTIAKHKQITLHELINSSKTKNVYQNTTNEIQRSKQKNWPIPNLLESPKSKDFQSPDLEIDFLIDSGAESKIINIPTWTEIEILHPRLSLLKTLIKLATAQGSNLANYRKLQLNLIPNRTSEQVKLLNAPFKQTFHITGKNYNFVEIPFITKQIPTIIVLNSKLHVKYKYTRNNNTSLTSFKEYINSPHFLSKIYPIHDQQRKHLKPLSGIDYNFSINLVHQYKVDQNRQQLWMSDLELKPIYKFFRVTIPSIKFTKDIKSQT